MRTSQSLLVLSLKTLAQTLKKKHQLQDPKRQTNLETLKTRRTTAMRIATQVLTRKIRSQRRKGHQLSKHGPRSKGMSKSDLPRQTNFLTHRFPPISNLELPSKILYPQNSRRKLRPTGYGRPSASTSNDRPRYRNQD